MSFSPASFAARACTSRRSSRAGWPLIWRGGLAVDREERAGLERALDPALDVDVARRPLADPATGEMADRIDVRVLHRLEHALGRARVGRLVHRGEDPVERR